MTADASRIRRFWRSDDAGLLILGIITLLRGLSYTPLLVNVDRRPAHWLEGIAGPQIWAVVWIITGIVALVAIRYPTIRPTAVGAVAGLHAAWAASFLCEWIFGESHRGWVSAISYAGLVALTIWAFGRGQSGVVRIFSDGR